MSVGTKGRKLILKILQNREPHYRKKGLYLFTIYYSINDVADLYKNSSLLYYGTYGQLYGNMLLENNDKMYYDNLYDINGNKCKIEVGNYSNKF